jgi:hypothetical protein
MREWVLENAVGIECVFRHIKCHDNDDNNDNSEDNNDDEYNNDNDKNNNNDKEDDNDDKDNEDDTDVFFVFPGFFPPPMVDCYFILLDTVAGQVQLNSEYFNLDSGFVMFHVEAKMEKGKICPCFKEGQICP